jgi:choline dehydrogenase
MTSNSASQASAALAAAGNYDFIIIGAGSAGSVLADRLSRNAGVRVLMLEAGRGRAPLATRIPAAFPTLFKSRHDWAFETEPEPALDGRRLFVPRGRLLGGSSAINAMIYIRGNRRDFDDWERGGARGWSFADALPYFLRLEDQARAGLTGHGRGGPLRIEDQRSPNPLSRAFIDACEQRGIARNDDFNGATQLGAGLYQVTQKAGRRWSAADAYLFPALGRNNFDLVSGALVRRIVLEQNRAVAVEYERAGRLITQRANREILLCAGTIGSPQILMLSGIGPTEQLRQHGLDVRIDLPGVGENLQDHPIAGLAYECTKPVSLRNAEGFAALIQYLIARRGPLTSNIAEAGAFVCSSPELELPDLQFHFAPTYFIDHGFQRPPGHGFSLGPVLVAPKSRGCLRLRSADPRAPPLLFGRHLSEESDLHAMLRGLELARSIIRAPAFDPYRGREYLPGASAQSEAELRAHLRATTALLYHPVGTCKLGVGDDCVVDPELRVRGVECLRVADASIMPIIPRGNTNAPTLMIAERLAEWLT